MLGHFCSLIAILYYGFQWGKRLHLCLLQEVVSLSEGSTVDLRRPGEEDDDLSDLAEDAMDPDECFPECK